MSEPKPTAAACLVVLRGQHMGEAHALPVGGRLRIGSGEDQDICLSDDFVSQAHCELACVDDDGQPVFIVVDRQSSGGTFINDSEEPVATEELLSGDVITIGQVTLLFIRLPHRPFSSFPSESPDVSGWEARAKERLEPLIPVVHPNTTGPSLDRQILKLLEEGVPRLRDEGLTNEEVLERQLAVFRWFNAEHAKPVAEARERRLEVSRRNARKERPDNISFVRIVEYEDEWFALRLCQPSTAELMQERRREEIEERMEALRQRQAELRTTHYVPTPDYQTLLKEALKKRSEEREQYGEPRSSTPPKGRLTEEGLRIEAELEAQIEALRGELPESGFTAAARHRLRSMISGDRPSKQAE